MYRHNAQKIAAMFVIILALTLLAAGAAYGADYTKTIDVAPFIENGRAYDTTRSIAETFGIYVDWDQASRQVTLSRGAYRVVMQVDSDQMVVSAPEGVRTETLDVVPILREGRVFLPVRLWAEAFGLQVTWRDEDGLVVVTEGQKTLTAKPGENRLALTGGHFLKMYSQGDSLSFYYPETAIPGADWEGHAEVLFTVDGTDYVISAVNAGAGRSDPVQYTEEEIESLIRRNAEENDTVAESLPSHLFGVPAYRVSGSVGGLPQAGVVFLQDGFLCGLTVELKVEPPAAVASEGEEEGAWENLPAELEESELHKSAVDEPVVIEEGKRAVYQSVIDALLDELMASFRV